MRIALVHDYIKEYGGAERVLEALHEVFPEAPIFTTVYLPDFLGPHKDRFKDWDIRTSILQYLPFKAKLISLFRIIAPLVFRQFDFSPPDGGFDAIIVSATGAYIPNTISNKQQATSNKKFVHFCYCHTPPRYLYGYATARDWKKNVVFKVLGEVVNHFLRQVDFKSAQNVDFFIANSKEVASRIKKFYRRESTVIYPPVNLEAVRLPHVANDARRTSDDDPSKSSSSLNERRSPKSPFNSDIKTGSAFSSFASGQASSSGYFLAGGRLARPKNIVLIVETCVKLGVPLKVFGRGFAGYEKEFKIQNSKFKITGQKSKVEFVGEVSDEEKMGLMRNAKAYIFASEDEDFGITPVEAMSAGTPVVAYRSGGVQESVIEGKTGVFFNELSIDSLTKAIQHFNDMNHYSGFNPQDCIAQAQKFSEERFKKGIKTFIEKIKNYGL